MTSVVQFEWNRLEGIGLIITALGWAIIAQIPVLYWGIILLNLDLNEYLLGVIGTTFGVAIILATLACTFAEEWNPSEVPTLKKVVTFSSFFILLFLIIFFGFFIIVEGLIPRGLIGEGLNPEQRYFSAIFLGLATIAILTYAYYKLKHFFR